MRSAFNRMIIYACLPLAALLLIGCTAAQKGSDTYTDVAILSTTDMHGKGWDTNLLTDRPEKSSMLRVATAAAKTREEFGEDNVILIDNGDLYQGTPFSQLSLLGFADENSSAPSMSVCIEKIGYDAFIPGNHEFDYDWDLMEKVYGDLEENGVPVVACNICYDGSDAAHESGETVFTPYVTRTIKVNGNEHKIGILGIGNTDIPRWVDSSKYPGLSFAHPGNQNLSVSEEASMYIPEMMKEGCEFIIVSYHGGMGSDEGELVPLVNSEHQGMRLASDTAGIGLLITGHDHSSAYSNTAVTGPDGDEVPVVNSGGMDMTKCVFRFTEDEEGSLKWEMKSTENLALSEYEPDNALKGDLQSYADSTAKEVSKPIGKAEGNWDNNPYYFTSQTDTMDVVFRAVMDIASAHGDVDMTMSTVTPAGTYTIKPGDISEKDVYNLYQFSNNLAILPMKGSEIRAALEENASDHFTVRILDGKDYFYSKGDPYANIITGGLNFTYDMSQPEGSRVNIGGFSNGKPFDDSSTYNVAVITYLLGNTNCGLRDFTEDDLIWRMDENCDEGSVRDMLSSYIRGLTKEGISITPEMADWSWSMEYSGDKSNQNLPEEKTAAVYSPELKDGSSYVIYQESEGMTFISGQEAGEIAAASCTASGSTIASPLPENTLILTAHDEGGNTWSFTSRDGKYVSGTASGQLILSGSKESDGSSLWMPEKHEGGYFLSCRSNPERAVQIFKGAISSYNKYAAGGFFFNFYEVT